MVILRYFPRSKWFGCQECFFSNAKNQLQYEQRTFSLFSFERTSTFDPNCLIFSYSHYGSFFKNRYTLNNGRRTSFRFLSILGEHLLDFCLFFFKLKYSLTNYFPAFPLCTFLMFSTGTVK